MSDSCLLYYITDRTAFGADEPTRRRHVLEKIVEAARAGVDYIQIREKDLSTYDLESLAQEAATLISKLKTENRELRTALLINSRTDVALAVGADGVHLRSDDVSPIEVRAMWKKGTSKWDTGSSSASSGQPPTREIPTRSPVVAVSCHSPAEIAQAAASGAVFALFGPVFEKKDAAPTGLNLLHQACRSKIPVLAIGGVTAKNAPSCLAAGAAGIAGIRLFQEHDVAQLVRQLRHDR